MTTAWRELEIPSNSWRWGEARKVRDFIEKHKVFCDASLTEDQARFLVLDYVEVHGLLRERRLRFEPKETEQENVQEYRAHLMELLDGSGLFWSLPPTGREVVRTMVERFYSRDLGANVSPRRLGAVMRPRLSVVSVRRHLRLAVRVGVLSCMPETRPNGSQSTNRYVLDLGNLARSQGEPARPVSLRRSLRAGGVTRGCDHPL